MNNLARPCSCGRKFLEEFSMFGNYTIKCPACGKEAYGKSRNDVVRNWNEMVKREKENGNEKK